jgi:HlyD family secretion protein
VLDTRDRNAALEQTALDQIKVAESRLAQVKAGAKTADVNAQQAEVERYESALKNATSELARNENLWRTKAVSASVLDEHRMTQETQQRLLNAARERLNSVREVRDVDVNLAGAELEVAKARSVQAHADFEQSHIRAPIDGSILRIIARPGELVTGDGLLEMGNTERMFVLAEVFETDIRRVGLGQKAQISGGALPEPIEGEVAQIATLVKPNRVLDPDPALSTDSRIIEVKIRLREGAVAARLIGAQVNVVIRPAQEKKP